MLLSFHNTSNAFCFQNQVDTSGIQRKHGNLIEELFKNIHYILKNEDSASSDLLWEVLLAIGVESAIDAVSDDILHLNLVAIANQLDRDNLE